MNRATVDDHARDAKRKIVEAADKVTGGQNTNPNVQPRKHGGKHRAVLADINSAPRNDGNKRVKTRVKKQNGTDDAVLGDINSDSGTDTK